MTQKKPKLLSVTQAYMSLFNDKLRPLIVKEWTLHVLSERTEEEKADVIPPVSIAFRNQFAKKSLSLEPPEVQEEVEEYRQKLREDVVDEPSALDTDGSDEEAKRVTQARSYHG